MPVPSRICDSNLQTPTLSKIAGEWGLRSLYRGIRVLTETIHKWPVQAKGMPYEYRYNCILGFGMCYPVPPVCGEWIIPGT
jgi:hypothetical protein